LCQEIYEKTFFNDLGFEFKMDLLKRKYNFPEDVEIFDHHLKLSVKEKKILFDEILSLDIFSSETKMSMNLVPMGSATTESEITIFHEKDKTTIRLKPFVKQWPFKNKKGQNRFEEILYFYHFLEERTFSNRYEKAAKLIKTLPENTLYSYQDYVFLKDKTIMKNKKIIASYDTDKSEISRSYKKINFKTNKKGLASFFEKELELNISQDEDVFLHLFKFTTGLSFKNYNYKL